MSNIEEINRVLEQIVGMPPLVSFNGTKEAKTMEVHLANEALARMYSDPGFRTYLQKTINHALMSAALNSKDEKEMYGNKMRVLTLWELYVKSKQAYEDYGKLQIIKIKIKENAKAKQNKENTEVGGERIEVKSAKGSR